MSLTVTKRSIPATPAADKSKIQMDTVDNRYKQIDYNGVISTFNNDGLRDRNILSNAGFTIQQRIAVASTAIPGISTTTRAGQVADRWAVTVGNVTTCLWQQVDTAGAPEVGLSNRYYGRITQATNAAKFTFSQWILGGKTAPLRGKKIRASIKIKQFVGSNQTYKLAILQLTAAGTVDVSPAFTSAIGASGVDPTWGTNLVKIAADTAVTPENGTIVSDILNVTSTAGWVRSSFVLNVPTDCKNLVFVIWKDATGGATDSLGVAEFGLTQGYEVVDYIPEGLAYELRRCQRFFCKSFPISTVPAAALTEAAAGTGAAGIIGKAGAVALAAIINVQFPVVMWKTPVVTLFTPVGAGAVPFRITGTGPVVQTAVAQRGLTDRGLTVTATGDAAGAVGDLVGVHYIAEAEFIT